MLIVLLIRTTPGDIFLLGPMSSAELYSCQNMWIITRSRPSHVSAFGPGSFSCRRDGCQLVAHLMRLDGRLCKELWCKHGQSLSQLQFSTAVVADHVLGFSINFFPGYSFSWRPQMKFSHPRRRAILPLLAVVSISFSQDVPPTIGNCNPSHDHLDPSSHRFISSCPDEMYCSPIQNQMNTSLNSSFMNEQDIFVQDDSTQDQDSKQRPIPTLEHENRSSGEIGHNVGGVCVPRACRRDEYPFGFPSNSTLPPLCFFPSSLSSTYATGYFCPDSGNGCRIVLSPGSTCELARDEQCAVEPIGLSDKGVNEGALCLNRVCTYVVFLWTVFNGFDIDGGIYVVRYVNGTFENSCVMENTTYTFPSVTSHSLYSLSVIRHNCVTGLYCEPTSLTCVRAKAIEEPCNADFECVTVSRNFPFRLYYFIC